MSLLSTSRRLCFAQLYNNLTQVSKQKAAPTYSAFTCRRYSSSSSSSNSRNGGILGRAPALRRKVRTIENTSPAVVTVPGTEMEVSNQPKPAANADSIQTPPLPFVPTTGHLERADVAVSTFFALHRPVSIVFPVPGTYSESAFSTIFDQRSVMSKNRQQVYPAASSTTEGIDGEEALSYSVSAANKLSPSTLRQIAHSPIHLPQHILQPRYQHFTPPPLPQPIPNWHKSYDLDQLNSRNDGMSIYPSHSALTAAHRHEPRRKQVITIHSKIADGSVEVRAEIGGEVVMQPFLRRMHQRRREWHEKTRMPMKHTLSVKRQRKLKMKKHKYKKLMRKTRSERRKLAQQ